MTKAETKALEKYPVKHRLNKKATGEFDSNLPRRKAYIEGYNQAIEDACEYLQDHIDKGLTIYHEQTWCKRDEFINRLKQAMEE